MSEPNVNDGGPVFPAGMVVTPNNGLVPTSAVTDETGMSLRDWLAAHERLAEWDSGDAVMRTEMAEALAGRKQPGHGWACATPEEFLEMLQWEADWRAALKYIRADAMLKAREGKQ